MVIVIANDRYDIFLGDNEVGNDGFHQDGMSFAAHGADHPEYLDFGFEPQKGHISSVVGMCLETGFAIMAIGAWY